MAGPKPAVLPITPRGSDSGGKFSNSLTIPKEDIVPLNKVRGTFFLCPKPVNLRATGGHRMSRKFTISLTAPRMPDAATHLPDRH